MLHQSNQLITFGVIRLRETVHQQRFAHRNRTQHQPNKHKFNRLASRDTQQTSANRVPFNPHEDEKESETRCAGVLLIAVGYRRVYFRPGSNASSIQGEVHNEVLCDKEEARMSKVPERPHILFVLGIFWRARRLQKLLPRLCDYHPLEYQYTTSQRAPQKFFKNVQPLGHEQVEKAISYACPPLSGLRISTSIVLWHNHSDRCVGIYLFYCRVPACLHFCL